jgi:flagellin-like protein
MFGKKGVSPLIATVLLIAFSVALGAVVMTYSGSLGECGSVYIELVEKGGEPEVCLDGYDLIFTLENGPKEAISSFKLTYYGNLDATTIDLEETLGPGEVRKFTTEYNSNAFGALEKFKIVPVVIENGGQLICPSEKSIIVQGIPRC